MVKPILCGKVISNNNNIIVYLDLSILQQFTFVLIFFLSILYSVEFPKDSIMQLPPTFEIFFSIFRNNQNRWKSENDRELAFQIVMSQFSNYLAPTQYPVTYRSREVSIEI